jgi:hypothetical protein
MNPYLKAVNVAGRGVGAIFNGLVRVVELSIGEGFLEKRRLRRTEGEADFAMNSGLLVGLVGSVAGLIAVGPIGFAGAVAGILPAHLQAAFKASQYDAARENEGLTAQVSGSGNERERSAAERLELLRDLDLM